MCCHPPLSLHHCCPMSSMSHPLLSTPQPPSLHLGLTRTSPHHATTLTHASHLPTTLHHAFYPCACATTLLCHCTTTALHCPCPTFHCPLHGPPPYTWALPICPC